MSALDYHAAVAHVLKHEPTFAVTTAEVRGVEFRVFENIPPTVPALLVASRTAQGEGAAEYLSFEGETWTFDEFFHDVNKLARVLEVNFGVASGTRVGIAMRNCPELMISVMAISRLGGVVVFLNAWWTAKELDYALSDSGARVVLADADRAARLDALRTDHGLKVIGVRGAHSDHAHDYAALMAASEGAPTDAVIDTDDDFAIMYSSGTTDHPKGVVQTHRGAVNAVFTFLMQALIPPLMDPDHDPDAPRPRPVGLVATPLFHVTATHPVFLLSLPAGAKLVVLPKWDACEAVRLIRDHGITRFIGVPAQSADLMTAAVNMGETLETLEYLGAGGAKRPAAQVAELVRVFPKAAVATGWGMTETNAIGIGMMGADYEARPGSAGRLYPPLQDIRFLNDDGADVGIGEVGEITVKSPCNMREYLNKPDATAEVLKDGWLRTGDLGYMDDEGYVTIVDRKKNIIIRGGENIACLDVEGALHRHPAVAEACAFSVPDARLGEVVGAGVQLRPGMSVSAEDLSAFLKDHIAHFKIPAWYWFRDTALPRGATDKVDRRGLRAACLEDIDA